MLCSLRLCFLIGVLVALCAARVERVDVQWSGPVLDGKAFGKTGAYEAARGVIHFSVDPNSSENSQIVDLKLAPVGADGEVKFSADFYLLWPQDPRKGNGTVLSEAVNRGNKLMLEFFQGAVRAAHPTGPEHFGDGFLMEQGFTLLWVGWQPDMPKNEGLVRVHLPVAKNADGSAIRGLVRSEVIVADRVYDYNLGDRDHQAYPVADAKDTRNVLTVRDTPQGSRAVIPRDKWKFARMENGKAVDDPTRVFLDGGFEPHRIYDVVYVAENPPVVGLGIAALRDSASYLKHAEGALFGVEDYHYERVIAFGVSQSGRLLRSLLYYGLNEDEDGRRAFDGILSHVAGGGRGSFNQRFAQPSRDGRPFAQFLYPIDIYPFSDKAQEDPETGRDEGILTRQTMHQDTVPKIFYTNSAYEYWGRAASQIHTTLDGKKDLELEDTTRIYMFAGTQHGVGPWTPKKQGSLQYGNNHDYMPPLRALLVALDAWVRNGKEPPLSQYPRFRDKNLTAPEKLKWPKIAGAPLVTNIQRAYRVDYGPRFLTEGIIDKEPPVGGKAFPLFVSQVDADGNELAGIRLPEITVPLATYTGWNPFDGKSGPSSQLTSMVGSFLPLPRDKAEARAKSDGRRPIEGRYASRDAYLKEARAAAQVLVRDGYLLERDVDGVVNRCARLWDWVMEQPAVGQ